MAKVIRSTYPKEFSIGLLILIFALSFFLSSQIFQVTWAQLMEGNTPAYSGMFLVSCAVLVMVLILWEEFMFPVHVKPTTNGLIFRNHRTKLLTQLLIYLFIPAIFAFVYLNYPLHTTRFYIWAGLCSLTPIVLKLVSGLTNYNDFLTLTTESIQYKNNTETGTFPLREIQQLILVRDQRRVLHKIEVVMTNNQRVTIDLDEMELDAFLTAIDAFINKHYQPLITGTGTSL